MRQLMISIDVEAQPARAASDPLERLIWGRFPGSEEAGIGRMMSIAEKHGVKLTMFLDYCEVGLYGEALLDVAREIHRRGHDLQLHAHLDFMPKTFWEKVGGTPEYNLNRLSPALAQAAVEALCDAQLRATGKAATAFRGGGYRYCGNLLDALMAQGVRLNSSVNISRNTQPIELGNSKQFFWSNGCLEVPVSVVEGYRNLNRPFDFNFNAMSMPDPAAMSEYLDVFHAERGEDAVAVLVMHSWSLLNLTDKRHFTHVRPDLMERFDGFLCAIKGKSTVVTCEDLLEAHDAGRLAFDAPQNFDALPKREGGAGVAAANPAPGRPVIEIASDDCPICSTPKRKIVDMNGRHCPKCRSLERQRVLSLVLDKGRDNLPNQKLGKMLFVSPSQAEREVFKAWPGTEFTTVDVRPEAKTDFQADICAMPQVPSGTFDTVFASYVMMCVHDLAGALNEINRVLQPGGTFISVEQVRYGEASRETSDDKTITGWYGAEAFEKYKVGSFRTLGKDDYEALLNTYFDVTVIEGIDPVTKLKLPVFFARKKKVEREQRAAVIRPTVAAPAPPDFPAAPDAGMESQLLAEGEELWNSARTEDHAEAVVRFHLAYQLFSNPLASYRLGCAYMLPRGVPRSPQLAATLVEAACKAGMRYGHYYRGMALSDDENAAKDLNLARIHLETALGKGVEEAVARLAKLPSAEKDELAVSPANLTPNCTICGAGWSPDDPKAENCPECHSRPRTRTVPLICTDLGSAFDALGPTETRRLLGFAMPTSEVRALKRHFGELVSASLYGKYSSEHIEGVDARDLSRFDDASFSGVYGVLLFDYFVEHDQSLKEVARCLKPGGVLFTHIAGYRLLDDDSAPINTAAIKKKQGYFDYVPDDANMPSIKVGRAWFIKAIERAGLKAEHRIVVDPCTGQKMDWFIGIKPSDTPMRLASDGSETQNTAEMLPLPGGRFRQRPIGIRSEGKDHLGNTAVVYKAKLPASCGAKEIRVTLSSPEVPKSLRNAYFAEHVRNGATGAMTDTVILCGKGGIGVSENLGKSWRRIDVPGAKDVLIWNCFTTASGRHIVQSHGWQGTAKGAEDASLHGVIHLFDAKWNYLGRRSAGTADWHGTASIGQAGKTIMFANYYNNSERYFSDFDARRDELLPALRSTAIWRSQDDGESWQKVLEQDPLTIRHFHTVQPDPFEPRTWWASSGDQWSECKVWRSQDDGDTWVELTPETVSIELPFSDQKYKNKCFRFTDIIVLEDKLIWGTDDLLGAPENYNFVLPKKMRAGSRIYASSKTSPLNPVEIAYCGQTLRKTIDVGPGYLFISEAHHTILGLNPQVFYFDKGTQECHLLFEVDNLNSTSTGFTYSKGSVSLRNGVGFTFKSGTDVMTGNANWLRWEVALD